ncbi:9276_t:CDS:2, partial [Funneliformis mosseae]
NNGLTSEALEAFDQFLTMLNRYFNILEKLTNNTIANNDINNETITIKWYGSVISSSNTIWANSNWYQQAVFDDISINMHNDEIENYITSNGMCFGKVLMLCLVNISYNMNVHG